MIITSLLNSLKKLGVNKGDTICISSNAYRFGIPQEIRNEVHKLGPNFLLDSYIDTFIESVGLKEGNILMPTFTYSATKGEVFDVLNTKSQVGILTERFRNRNKSIRSENPIFSYASLGRQAKEILSDTDQDCFGVNSIYQKLKSIRAKYIMFGVSLSEAATHVYHSQQTANVYYRFLKSFKGEIKSLNSEIRRIDVSYFVRDHTYNLRDQWSDLENDSLKAGITLKEHFNHQEILLHEATNIDQFILEKLIKNKNYLVGLNE